MPCCKDCASFSPRTKETGECRINGEAPADRDSDRCPSRTFIPKLPR
ncbi:MAG: hypothetical protein NTY71_03790 [Methanoregula sp.]|nr:hypothetical protein [Methanoregula sp.]